MGVKAEMAEVTVELGRLLDKTNFKLFDFNYQFDDQNFKSQLEQSIIDFYYDYEIGFETPDMFKRKFKARFLRNIDYFNKLYNTTLLEYNPLSNYSLKEVLDQLATTSSRTDNTANTTLTNTGNTHTFSDIDNKISDYPQQPLAGGDYLAGQNNETNDTTIDSSENTTNTATGNVVASSTDNTDYTKTIEGITQTTYPELIQKHRDAIIQINNMVIEYMKPCFILVY
jgi:hypothetical protein